MKVTTVYGRNAQPKGFAWSWSRLKNFETCPRRHHAIDVAKTVKEADGGNLKYGNEVHSAFSRRLGEAKHAFPAPFAHFEDCAKRIELVPGRMLVEQKFAVTKEFGACEWFDTLAWFRSVADVVIINPPVALAIDIKLGKVVEDSQQLALMAACLFAHYPELEAVRTEFWWLKYDAVSRVDIRRRQLAEVWANIMPRVDSLHHAYVTDNFPPKKGGLCKRYCPVTGCENHGK